MKKLNTENELVDRALAAVVEAGVSIRWNGSRAGRGSFAVTWGEEGEATFPAVVLPGLTQRTSGPLLALVEPGAAIVTEHVPSALGQLLRHRGHAYLDAVGNAYLRDCGLLIDIRGRSAARTPSTGSLFTKSAVPVVLTFLNAPGLLHAPLREVVERVPVSLGTVQRVRKTVQERVETEHHEGMHDGWERLALEWSSYYLATYRPTLDAETYSTALDTSGFRAALDDGPAVVSGEWASAMSGADLLPGSCDLYCDAEEMGAVRRALRLRRDPLGDVTLRRTFWNQELLADDRGARGSVVAPRAVVWSDLAAIDDPRVRDVMRAMGGAL